MLGHTRKIVPRIFLGVALVDAPADFLIRAWPENTDLLASESRWNRIYCLDKIRRDIPEFQPRISVAEGIPASVAWMEERGLLQDARSDDTKDRLVAAVRRLGKGLYGRPS